MVESAGCLLCCLPMPLSWLLLPCAEAAPSSLPTVGLLQLLDKLHMDDRHAERPLRVPVLDRYNDRGTMVLGKVEQVRLGLALGLDRRRQQRLLPKAASVLLR